MAGGGGRAPSVLLVELVDEAEVELALPGVALPMADAANNC